MGSAFFTKWSSAEDNGNCQGHYEERKRALCGTENVCHTRLYILIFSWDFRGCQTLPFLRGQTMPKFPKNILSQGKLIHLPKGKSPHSLSISFSFPFQNFKPIFSHYNYSSMELNGTGFSQAFPFNFHFIPQTIPRIFPYSSHSFPLIFPGSSLTIFSFSFLALFSFLSRQLGTLTSLYEIEREPFHFHFFLQTFLLGIRRG